MADFACPHFLRLSCNRYRKCVLWNYCEARKRFHPDKKNDEEVEGAGNPQN